MCYFHSPVSFSQSWSQADHCWLLAPSWYFESDRCMFTGPLGWFRLLVKTMWWEFLRPCLFPRGFYVPCMIESDWHLDIRTGGGHLSSLVACQVWNFFLCSAGKAMLKLVVFGWIVSLVVPGLFKCQTLEGQTHFISFYNARREFFEAEWQVVDQVVKETCSQQDIEELKNRRLKRYQERL